MEKDERIKQLKQEGKNIFLYLKNSNNVVRGQVVSYDEEDGEIELVFAPGVPGVESKSYVQIEDVELIQEIPEEDEDDDEDEEGG